MISAFGVTPINGWLGGNFRPCSLASRLQEAGCQTLSAVVLLDKDANCVHVWKDDPAPVQKIVRVVADGGHVCGIVKLFTKHLEYVTESPDSDIKTKFFENMARDYARRVSHLKEVN